MVPAFFVNLHACGGGLSAIQFGTAGSAQRMLSATPSRGMSLMVAGGVSLCELRAVAISDQAALFGSFRATVVSLFSKQGLRDGIAAHYWVKRDRH